MIWKHWWLLLCALPLSKSDDEAIFFSRHCSVAGADVVCSCHGNPELTIHGLQSWLPEGCSTLTITDCRQSRVRFAGSGEETIIHHLQQMTFSDIHELIIDKSSVDFDVRHSGVFIMTVLRVTQLKLTRGSIRLSGAASAVVFSDVWSTALPSFSIESTSLKLLRLNGVRFTGLVAASAVILQSPGAVVEVIEVDGHVGFQAGWVHGRISSLVIRRSKLALYPGAFNRLNFADIFVQSISLHDNVFWFHENVILGPNLSKEHEESNMWVNASGNTISCSTHSSVAYHGTIL
ncbi:uncharacterized protein LOC108681622 [Hyalella azteca]|uniref:Uncharacterized protein LOC108681622 n=1 Tax=Hyalella azteca TaxID=294128 RepID=A0A8B7PL72_HYAAZ|nr:uncharacterized protein LOC108681622 [Hyalella azteca]